MKSEAVTKQIIQGLALGYVALGTWLGYLSCQTFVKAVIGESYGISLCFLVPLSITAFALAVQNISSPEAIAIRNLVAATMVIMCCGLIFVLNKIPGIADSFWIKTLILCVTPLLTIFLYISTSRYLLKKTGCEEPVRPQHLLYARIARQNISAPSKESLKSLMPIRQETTVVGYFLIVFSWVLFALSFFLTMMSVRINATNPEFKTDSGWNVGAGFFWGAAVIHEIGRVHLKKVALAKAVIEMLDNSSNTIPKPD